MLEIFNTLKPFFEDCYSRINVREYARIQKISPPTASKILENLYKEGLLKKEKEKIYNYYFVNKDSELFVELSRIYWKKILEDSGLLKELEKNLLTPIVYLFGSLSKGEAKIDSDIDLAIFTPTKKEINLEKFEKLLKRRIQIFVFRGIEDVKSENLLKNILNGFKIKGNW
ncbi:MAG: nucleotidyltransferase domain-containing protein [Candidatus Woesearchaeota archaeon]